MCGTGFGRPMSEIFLYLIKESVMDNDFNMNDNNSGGADNNNTNGENVNFNNVDHISAVGNNTNFNNVNYDGAGGNGANNNGAGGNCNSGGYNNPGYNGGGYNNVNYNNNNGYNNGNYNNAGYNNGNYNNGGGYNNNGNYNGNGYNNGNYNNNDVYYDIGDGSYDPNYRGYDDPKSGKTGLAVASLILGIIGFICCCCGFGYVLAPLSIILGIISLATHRGGKGFAVTGIILSAITIIILVIFALVYGPIARDYIRFVSEADKVIEEYAETGELPDYLDKYNDPKYKDFWESNGYKNFNDFLDDLIDQLKKSGNSGYDFGTGDNLIALRPRPAAYD